MRHLPGRAFVLMLLAATTVRAAEPPSTVLDLSRWKLTLPVDRDSQGHADEVRAASLKTFSDPQSFFVSEDRSGVVFRAPCGGATTKGSRYPRCELREMNAAGDTPAGWSTDDPGPHGMTLQVAITKTPPVKKHVVCAQIHDREDDLLMIRLEGRRLFIERNELEAVSLDQRYEPGTPFELKIEAGGGRVRVWHDGVEKLNWKCSRSGCYFKTGCYTQSNLDRGDAADSFGEVVIRRLKVDHPAGSGTRDGQKAGNAD